MLQGVIDEPSRDFNLPSNPVKQVDKPSQRREREPLLVGVEQVETMRLHFLAHDDLRSAALLSLLAYAGPRPEPEALPLRWSAVRKHTILFRATKRGVTAERATRLLRPIADDLAEWRLAAGNPPSDAPVIPNRRGRPWSASEWDNWRKRGFRPAARAAGLPAGDADGPKRVRPRDLRSSFATLLIYEGPPQYVAEQLGHSARPRCCGTTRASGRTSTHRSARAPSNKSRACARGDSAPHAAKETATREASSAVPRRGPRGVMWGVEQGGPAAGRGHTTNGVCAPGVPR